MTTPVRFLSSTVLALTIAGTTFGQAANNPVNLDFNSNNSATYRTNAQAIPGTVLTVSTAGSDAAALLNNNRLELTTDRSGDGDFFDSDGFVFAYGSVNGIDTTYFKKGFNRVATTGRIEWTFNMRQSNTNPSGLNGSGEAGVAMILGGSSTTANNAGHGYAVVLGSGNANDFVRLVSYNNGLGGTLTDIVAGTTDYATQYLSIKVTYTRASNTWSLYVRNDGNSAFADPATLTNANIITGSNAVNTTYTTSNDLNFFGPYLSGRDNGDNAYFDNFNIAMANAASGAPLPVTLTYFKGNVQDNLVNLSWETSEEKNFSHYEIERSTDGKAYNTVNEVKGKGAYSEYDVNDNISGISASTMYYRLKAVDADGSFKYSSVVRLSNKAEGLGEVSAYPNPFRTELSVQISTEEDQLATLMLYSLDGRLVQQRTENVKQGSNVVTLSGLDQLANGMYVLNVQCGGEVKSVRLVK